MKFLITILTIVATTLCLAQNTIPKALDKLNKKTVPYITVAQLPERARIVLLDARETKEFNVSHIKNAINVGFDHFDKNGISMKIPNKDATIIVYCSIGVRSEKIGEKLLKMGYKNVFNLYGGIFEWKNNGGKLIDNKGVETNNVHTFNKEWSQYLKKGNKVYED
ncbi:rhodanese-related sulfurtransferase [Flavobacterium sp. CG_23.5]|uniref:rhodanese-like domain-containing protein n=1 Tax=unclassified Flavobacterium TaxID=196869 RepID=UPI0018C90F85|nr:MULTISPECIES: rhodanese-like domain-containing protein [unclassified Flavobacterium]MBG6109729.1 rhodanese-related sulfurtransferase [Flavobacterium sp. CG_9.10]MBP2284763.1 rhodanese-related sulfurtransferase [Flavobacterium sp. CG_23.5]